MSARWPELMTQETAAAYLDMSEREFRLMRARDARIQPVSTHAKSKPRFRRSDLDSWIERLDAHSGKQPRQLQAS